MDATGTPRLELRMVVTGPWQENCYLLVDPDTKQSLLIDPGDEAGRILPWLSDTTVLAILLTHADIDHVGVLDEVRNALSVRASLHPDDNPLAAKNGVSADYELHDGDKVQLGQHTIEVVHTPGHSAGSVSLRFDNRAIVGDAIFPGGPGRTRPPYSLKQALAVLQRTVFTWPDETTLYSGHGDPTTVGRERPDFEAFMASPRPADSEGNVSWRAGT